MAEVTNVSDSMDGIDPDNRADKPVPSARIKVELLSRLDAIRGDKKALHQEWGASWDVWNQVHRVRLYEGASDLYIPVARNIVETFVAQIKAGIFPNSHKFWIESNANAPGPDPKVVGELMKHCIDQAKVEKHIEALIRNALIYGTAIVKFPWVTKSSAVYRRRKTVPPEMAAMMPPDVANHVSIQKEQVKTYDGPDFRVVDPFRFHIFPITCRDVDDAQLIFEDFEVSYAHLQAMEEKGIYSNVKRVRDQGASATEPADSERSNRLNKYGINVQQGRVMGGGNDQYGNLYTITEIWCNYDLDGTGEEIPCKVVSCNDIILEARPNPFFHQRAPYRAWKLIDFPDLFFGQGIVTGLKHQNYAVNALTNQGIDAAVYQSNPIVIANAMALTQGLGSIKLGHRSVIYVNGKPSDGLEFVKIPDTSPTAFATASLIMQAMRDMAGAPPILQGKLGSNEQTATESSILQNNAQSGVINFIKGIEASILSPMLYDWYLLLQQFLDEKVWLTISGQPKPFGVSAQDLVGDYKFRWLVGSGVGDEMQAMQQQAMAEQMSMPQPQMGMPGMGAPGGPQPSAPPASMGGMPLVGGPTS